MVFEFSFAFQTLIMIYSVKEFLEDGVYIPTDVKVKQMKRAMPDCVTVRDKPSALKAEDWDWVVVVFVLSRFSIRLAKIVNLWNVKIISVDLHRKGGHTCYFKGRLLFVNTLSYMKSAIFFFLFPKLFADLALMSEFDAENKGDNGDVQTTYTGEGKGDDSESLMSSMQRTKSRAAARSEIITHRVKGRKLSN
ncbi:unnamed protein product [Malus baccata var. baccata]